MLADDEPDRRLEVDDDGCGLDPTSLGARLAEGHIGLASTRARVEGVGGTLLRVAGRAGSGGRGSSSASPEVAPPREHSWG